MAEEKTTEKKTKAKGQRETKESQPKTLTFPVKAAVNAYGFIHLRNGVAEAFGVPKGQKIPISIDLNEGALIIRKA